MTRKAKNNSNAAAAPSQEEAAKQADRHDPVTGQTTEQGSSYKNLDQNQRTELAKTDGLKEDQEKAAGAPTGPTRPAPGLQPAQPVNPPARPEDGPPTAVNTSGASTPSQPAWTPADPHTERPKPDPETGRPPAEETPTPELTADERARLAFYEQEYEELKIERAANRVKFAEMDERLAKLAAITGKSDSGPSQITIHGTAVDQKAFAENWAKRRLMVKDRWTGKDRRAVPADAPTAGRTYKIIPSGQSAKRGMPIAIVTNAADASDAKTQYALRLGQPGESITVNVELIEPINELVDSAEA